MIDCIATAAVVVVVVKDVFTTTVAVSLVVGVDIGLFFWKLLLLLAGLNMLLDRFNMASLAVAVVEFMWELGWRKLLIRLGSFDKDCGVNAFAGRENILRMLLLLLLLLGAVLVGVVILVVLV